MAARAYAGRQPWWGRLTGELDARLRSLSYVDTGKRDLRLDLLRGLAVSVMVVDHIGGDTVLTSLSGGNQFIVSAAEAFVFLSGLVVAMVYGEKMRRKSPMEGVRALLKRTLTLYQASVGLALAFMALFFFTQIQLWFGRGGGLTIADPFEALVGILTLHFSFHGSDVLVMYTLMLAASPAILYLLYRGYAMPVLVASTALWALYQRYPAQTAFPWDVVDSQFPVSAWQLVYVLGMVIGYHRRQVSAWLLAGKLSSRLLLFGLGGLTYLLAWSYQSFTYHPLPEAWFGNAAYGALFYKITLGPGRVLAFLGVAAMAYVIANALWAPIQRLLGWILIPLGQNSLYVYIMHIFVLVLLYNVAALGDLGLGQNLSLAMQVAGLGLVWIMVRGQFLFRLVPR